MADNYLEKALRKLASQINAYDEASLMDMWEKYAERVRHFEPTKQWEEDVLIFGIIQGMRLKNQLFNYNWALSRKPREAGEIDLAALNAPERKNKTENEPEKSPETEEKLRRGKILKLDLTDKN